MHLQRQKYLTMKCGNSRHSCLYLFILIIKKLEQSDKQTCWKSIYRSNLEEKTKVNCKCVIQNVNTLTDSCVPSQFAWALRVYYLHYQNADFQLDSQILLANRRLVYSLSDPSDLFLVMSQWSQNSAITALYLLIELMARAAQSIHSFSVK